eukprot:jgi/Mesvir1/16123/Mv26467-RA.1
MAQSRGQQDIEACRRCKRLLHGKSITSDSASFRQWARLNHPDRGGDTMTFQQVSSCFDMVHKEHCNDHIRNMESDLTDSSTFTRNALQVLLSSHIYRVAVDGCMVARTMLKTPLQRPTPQRVVGIRVRHKRISGIPLRLWNELEAQVSVPVNYKAARLTELVTSPPELHSVGVNWKLGRNNGLVLAHDFVEGIADEGWKYGAWRLSVRRTLGPVRVDVGVSYKEDDRRNPLSLVMGASINFIDIRHDQETHADEASEPAAGSASDSVAAGS